MAERPRFFDDLAGLAGGAMSVAVGMREEAEAMVRARLDEALRRLDLVRREEFEAVEIMAARARAAQDAAEAKFEAVIARLSALEAKVEALESAHQAAAQAPVAEAGPAPEPAPPPSPPVTSTAGPGMLG